MTPHKPARVEKILTGIIYALAGLLPVFIFPFASLFNSSKTILIVVCVFAAVIFFVVRTLRDGNILIPYSWILGSYTSVVLVYIVSALASPNRALSFMGFVGMDSVFFVVLCLVLLYIVSLVFVPRRRASLAVLCVLGGGALLAFLEICILLVSPLRNSLSFFQNTAVTFFGTSTDMAIFFGLTTIISMLALELPLVKGNARIGLWALFGASLFFLTATNVTMVWYIVALFALITFIYNFSTHVADHKRSPEAGIAGYHIPILPLAVLVVTVVFILLSNTNIYGVIGNAPGLSFMKVFNLSTVEARPALSVTLNIGRKVITSFHLLGSGPGRFREAWNLFRPVEVNGTTFWGTDFTVGYSAVSDSLVTLGLLGVFAWLWFIGYFVYVGFKSLFIRFEDITHRLLLAISFLSALYLWIFMLIYPPGIALTTLAFIFTGLFVSSLLHAGVIPLAKISITEDPRIAFAGVSGLVLVLIATVVVGYFFGVTITSATYAAAASQSYAQGKVDDAEQLVGKAIGLKEDDSYYRFLTTIGLARLTALVNSGEQTQDAKTRFDAFVQYSLQAASRAAALDGNDYQNWMSLGQVYQTITSSGEDSAYNESVKAYLHAETLNPKNPAIDLALANLAVTHGDNAKAKEYINSALIKKPDYTDAYFLRSQILVSEGSLKDAIVSAEAGTLTAPLNPGVFFQLGLLRYANKDYPGAISAFEHALGLDNNYANAQYFLGLSYDKVGRHADAIALFTILAAHNPDNQDVASILANLKAGRTDTPPPTTHKTTPPVKETR